MSNRFIGPNLAAGVTGELAQARASERSEALELQVTERTNALRDSIMGLGHSRDINEVKVEAEYLRERPMPNGLPLTRHTRTVLLRVIELCEVEVKARAAYGSCTPPDQQEATMASPEVIERCSAASKRAVRRHGAG